MNLPECSDWIHQLCTRTETTNISEVRNLLDARAICHSLFICYQASICLCEHTFCDHIGILMRTVYWIFGCLSADCQLWLILIFFATEILTRKSTACYVFVVLSLH